MAQSVKPVHCEHRGSRFDPPNPCKKARSDSTYLISWCQGSGHRKIPSLDQSLAYMVTSMYVHLHMNVHLPVNKHGHTWRSDEVVKGALIAHKRRDWYKLSGLLSGQALCCSGHSRVPIAMQIFLTAPFHLRTSWPLGLWMNEPLSLQITLSVALSHSNRNQVRIAFIYVHVPFRFTYGSAEMWLVW